MNDTGADSTNERTFSNRLSAYTNSACLSTGVMLFIQPTLLLEWMTETIEPSRACFLRCWEAIWFPCRAWFRAARRSYKQRSVVSSIADGRGSRKRSNRTSSSYDISPLTHWIRLNPVAK